MVLLAAVLLAMSVLLSTASVSGSGRSGQQQYIPPVQTSIPQVSAGEFKVSTRSAVELPSKRYRIAVERQAPVHELGVLEPARLLNLQANQIGVDRQITEDLDAGAREVANADGSAVRLFSIKSEGAQAVRVRFRGFDLPEGDQVFVYGATGESHVGGPYRGKGPFENGDFWADIVEGDTVFVEHFVAVGGVESKLSIPEISHAFKGFDASDFVPQLLSCHVDASCGEFVEKNAVARILFQDGGLFVCTGTLVNNRAQDHTPIFLTAAHCVNNETVAQSVEAFWFYQSSACNSGILRTGTSSQTGTTLLVTDRTTDSTLLRFNNAPPDGVAFVGWDPNPKTIGTTGFGLHHPAGGTPPSLTSFLRSSSGSIVDDDTSCTDAGLVSGYVVSWTNGDTEEGSSGSALFATDGAGVIGVLSCGPDPASCSNRLSLYSKFADFYSRAAAPILEGVGTTGPFITSVVPDAKNLIILGLNFDSGAKVFVDGVKQKTLRETATASTRLIAKKGFKKMVTGSHSVVVKNSDGSESPAVPFFKPGTALVIEQPRNNRPRGHFESGRNGAFVRAGDTN
jgi:V8-like Glu-specific endopeptidase